MCMSECERKMGLKSQVGGRDDDTRVPLGRAAALNLEVRKSGGADIRNLPASPMTVSTSISPPEFFFCPSFYWLDVFWAVAAAQKMKGGMCAGQRWPVLEYSGRFMGSTDPEGRRSHAASVTRCREHIRARRESDAAH